MAGLAKPAKLVPITNLCFLSLQISVFVANKCHNVYDLSLIPLCVGCCLLHSCRSVPLCDMRGLNNPSGYNTEH